MSTMRWLYIYFSKPIDEKKACSELMRFFEEYTLPVRDFRESKLHKEGKESDWESFSFEAYFPDKGAENYLRVYVHSTFIRFTLGSWMRASYFLPLVYKLIDFYGEKISGFYCGSGDVERYAPLLKSKDLVFKWTPFVPEYVLDPAVGDEFWLVFISNSLIDRVDSRFLANPNWVYKKFKSGILVQEYETIFDERERGEKGLLKKS